MGQNVIYQRELPVRYQVDILVAGGGPTGVAAAVKAARLGKKVLIVEQSGTFGGSSMLAGVPELMNFDDGMNFICKGFGEEVFQQMELATEFQREWYGVKPEKLKRVYDRLVKESGAETLFYTKLVDVICENGTVSQVVVSGADGLFAIEPKFCVDATGSGSLCAMAGADHEYGDENGVAMSATLCSIWGGVDFAKKGNDDGSMYRKAYADGVFSQYDTILPGIKDSFPEVGVGQGNIGHSFQVDDRSSESLTEATFHGREILKEYEVYYRNYMPGCENAQLLKSADFIGIRESRRIVCEYTLNQEDFFQKEPFFDEIGRYSYPIDIHPMSSDEKGMEGFRQSLKMRHKAGETYSIPYRCLIPKGLNNVLVGGRSVGTDHAMQASIRVIPGCYITGQACGVAAAVCIENGTAAKNADIKKIQKILAQK